MSHASGKVEIVAVDRSSIYLRYHQAKDPADLGRFLIAERDDAAGWLDELRIRDWTNAELPGRLGTAAEAPRQPEPLLAANSPLQLTEIGRTIAGEIGADAWAAELAPILTERAAAEPPYKVDPLCEDYVDRFLEQQMRDRVAEAAYEHGMERKDVLGILRVVLRNRLLADTGRDPAASKSKDGEPTTDGTAATTATTS